jgi:hypothetical protein
VSTAPPLQKVCGILLFPIMSEFAESTLVLVGFIDLKGGCSCK